jgi:rare lipoprotein A
MRSRSYGKANGHAALHAALTSSVAALAAACSQGGNTPARGIASDAARPSLARPIFSEDEYGVSTSPRVAAGGRVAKGGGGFKLGSPYKVAGRWYVPREEPGYDQQGVGSWYGDDFHGRKTANGEVFDMTALTAAHPTLPLPCYAYVTNLDTGRTILVRVNDRGPYVNDRLIDLSHASARALGYEGRGMAHVRVRYAGRAPLNGDDRRERQFLAEQRWNTGRDMRAVAAYRPPEAPIAPPQPFPEGTPGRWSPTSYRAALAGKPLPQPMRPAAVPPQQQAYQAPSRPPYQQPYQTAYQPTGALPRPSALSGPAPVYAAQPPASGRAPESGRAYVQVGIFRDRANAERMRRELGSIAPVEVAPLTSGQGGEVYRVRLGPMSPTEANATLSRVASRGVSGSAVVFE